MVFRALITAVSIAKYFIRMFNRRYEWYSDWWYSDWWYADWWGDLFPGSPLFPLCAVYLFKIFVNGCGHGLGGRIGCSELLLALLGRLGCNPLLHRFLHRFPMLVIRIRFKHSTKST
jgi:hypothetical protein